MDKTKPPTFQTLTFTASLDWELESDAVAPQLSLSFPSQFAKPNNNIAIDTKISSKSFSSSKQQKIDDNFLLNSLVSPFIFKIDFKNSSHRSKNASSSRKKKSEDSKNTNKQNKNESGQNEIQNTLDTSESKSETIESPRKSHRKHKSTSEQNNNKETQKSLDNDANPVETATKSHRKHKSTSDKAKNEEEKNKLEKEQKTPGEKPKTHRKHKITKDKSESKEDSNTLEDSLSQDTPKRSHRKHHSKSEQNEVQQPTTEPPKKSHRRKKSENKEDNKSSQQNKNSEQNIAALDNTSSNSVKIIDQNPKNKNDEIKVENVDDKSSVSSKSSKKSHHRHKKTSEQNENQNEKESPKKSHRRHKDKSGDKNDDKNTSMQSETKTNSKVEANNDSIQQNEEKTNDSNKKHRSKSSLDKAYIQIDGHNLYFPNSVSASSKICPPGFKKFNFTITVSSPLLTDYVLKRFAPAFLHIQQIENAKQEVYLSINDKYVLSDNNIVNSLMIFTPREQRELNIVLYNKRPISKVVCGNGLVKQGHSSSKQVGSMIYMLLPKRAKKIYIGQMQVYLETLDPAEKYGVPTIPIIEENTEPENGEPSNSKFYRWIASTERNPEGVKFCRKLMAFINQVNKDLPNYRKAVKTNFDVITGFHISTPKEDLFVIESRATEPKASSVQLSQLLNESPYSVHIVANTTISYKMPRLFKRLDTLFLEVMLPISVAEFVRIEGLYIRRSRFSSLFSVAQKIFDLFSIHNCGVDVYFPTYRELRDLVKRTIDLHAAPFSEFQVKPPISEPSETFDRRFLVLDKNKSNRISMEQPLQKVVETKQEQPTNEAPVILKPEPKQVLVMRMKKRTPTMKDHVPISTPPISIYHNSGRMSARRRKSNAKNEN